LGEDQPEWEGIYFAIYTPLDLFLLSIALCISSIVLVVNVRRHFPVGLKDEACRVQTINIIFTVTYLTRAITFIATHYFFANSNAAFSIPLTYYIGYIFWDVIPLILIMSYHYKNFMSETRRSTLLERNLQESIINSSPGGVSEAGST